MKVSNSTLAATVIGTVAGVMIWFSGLANHFWPTHAQMAAFLITLGTGIAAKLVWPDNPK